MTRTCGLAYLAELSPVEDGEAPGYELYDFAGLVVWHTKSGRPRENGLGLSVEVNV